MKKIMIKLQKKNFKELFDDNRHIVLGAFICLIFCAFVIRLVDWQIINYEEYKFRANSSNIYFVKTSAIRGEIVDRDGVGLAVNETGYKIMIDRLTLEKGTENCLILQSVNLLKRLGNEWVDILPIEALKDGYKFKDGGEKTTEKNIKDLKERFKFGEDATAEQCIKKLIEKYKAEDLTKEEQMIICSVRLGMEKIEGHNAKAIPYVICENANAETVSVLSEFSSKMKGIKIHTTLTRKYINGGLAPHLVGYTGAMSSEEYEKRKDTYAMDEKIGKTGIEQAMEEHLRGKSGKRMIQMDYSGNIVDVLDKESTDPGNTVVLSLSAKLQEAANKSLKENVERAHGVSKDCVGGGVVVLDVRDFSVLAASTYPTFDLVKFMEDKSYYSELYKDKSVPLLNRAFSGAFAPGSIYKPLVACAALQTGKLKFDEKIHCNGGFSRFIGYRLHCMGVHGGISVVDALCKSCNTFFAECGYRLRDDLAEYARRFGIGEKTGVEIGESSGVSAGTAHSEKIKSHWYEAGYAQSGIGQSDYMITPLQLAAYTATIANGGHRYKTHLVKKILNYSRNETIEEIQPELVCETEVSEENIRIVKEGMRKVALSGTARDFADYKPEVFCKTGTAQNNKADHTTFIVAAPYDNPEIAIAVVIPHGVKGSFSKNVARDILNCYFGKNQEDEKK